jgi:hypothetical protein
MDLVHPVEDGGSQSSTLYVRRRRRRRKRGSSKSVFERLIRTGTTEENKIAFQYKRKTKELKKKKTTHA